MEGKLIAWCLDIEECSAAHVHTHIPNSLNVFSTPSVKKFSGDMPDQAEVSSIRVRAAVGPGYVQPHIELEPAEGSGWLARAVRMETNISVDDSQTGI